MYIHTPLLTPCLTCIPYTLYIYTPLAFGWTGGGQWDGGGGRVDGRTDGSPALRNLCLLTPTMRALLPTFYLFLPSAACKPRIVLTTTVPTTTLCVVIHHLLLPACLRFCGSILCCLLPRLIYTHTHSAFVWRGRLFLVVMVLSIFYLM